MAKHKVQMKQRQVLSNFLLGLSLSFLPVFSLMPSVSQAETLQIPETAKAYSVTLPGRGMSMTEVLDKFGEPQTKDPEVGEPPITRWNYKNYSVVFEYQYVIHALSTNKPIGLKLPEQTQATDHDESASHSDTPHNASGHQEPNDESQNHNKAKPDTQKMNGHSGHSDH